MDKNAVAIGMKVVPHDKTVMGYQEFGSWEQSGEPEALFFENHGFLFVANRDDGLGAFWLSAEENEVDGGCVFRASDLTPYIEPEK